MHPKSKEGVMDCLGLVQRIKDAILETDSEVLRGALHSSVEVPRLSQIHIKNISLSPKDTTTKPLFGTIAVLAAETSEAEQRAKKKAKTKLH